MEKEVVLIKITVWFSFNGISVSFILLLSLSYNALFFTVPFFFCFMWTLSGTQAGVLISERQTEARWATDICDLHKNILHANATFTFSLPPCLLLNYVKCLETNHYSFVCYFITCFFPSICTPPVSWLERAGRKQTGTVIAVCVKKEC